MFRSGLPITMVGLDVTHQALFLDRATSSGWTRLAHAHGPTCSPTCSVLRAGSTASDTAGRGSPIHDAVAVAHVALPGLVTTQPYQVDVETTGEIDARPDGGATAGASRGPTRTWTSRSTIDRDGSRTCSWTRSPRSDDRGVRVTGARAPCGGRPSATRTRSGPRWRRRTGGPTSSPAASTPTLRRRSAPGPRREPAVNGSTARRRPPRPAAAAHRGSRPRVRLAPRRRQRRRPGRAGAAVPRRRRGDPGRAPRPPARRTGSSPSRRPTTP